ncbi:MAG: DNA repair protein RadA, partial [Desulfomonile sp.]|nr:DNA repair protein RadA [Desulfomonile sp.]
FGEVGLAGEVRRVSRAAARLTEAQRLGFTRIIAPRSNIEAWNGDPAVERIGISHVKELSRVLFEPRGGKGK